MSELTPQEQDIAATKAKQTQVAQQRRDDLAELEKLELTCKERGHEMPPAAAHRLKHLRELQEKGEL